MNDIVKSNPAETFRSVAADRLRSAADMSLHELVDEFSRLTEVINNGETERSTSTHTVQYTDEALVAFEERKLVNGATRARFGFGFDIYDSGF